MNLGERVMSYTIWYIKRPDMLGFFCNPLKKNPSAFSLSTVLSYSAFYFIFCIFCWFCLLQCVFLFCVFFVDSFSCYICIMYMCFVLRTFLRKYPNIIFVCFCFTPRAYWRISRGELVGLFVGDNTRVFCVSFNSHE